MAPEAPMGAQTGPECLEAGPKGLEEGPGTHFLSKFSSKIDTIDAPEALWPSPGSLAHTF